MQQCRVFSFAILFTFLNLALFVEILFLLYSRFEVSFTIANKSIYSGLRGQPHGAIH